MRAVPSAVVVLFLALGVSHQTHAQLAIRGELVYTMTGLPLRNGVVLVRDGKIEQVGSDIAIPGGYEILSAKVVTPGLIDAHSVVGLTGIYNQPHDQDQLDKTEAIQPELRALDAYNPHEQLVEWLRNLGITIVHTGPAPGALSSGQTIIAKTIGGTVGEAVIDSSAMVAFSLGSPVSQNFKSPGTRSKGVALLRAEFLKAREYLRKMTNKDPEKRPAPDLRMEILGSVLSGEKRALFTVNRATEIMSALRLAKEFGFRLVLDGAAESYLVVNEIKAAGVPVIVHPTMVRTYGDTRNATFETAAILKREGIPVAFQSGYEGYVPKTRVVLFEAALATANGLSMQDALAAITVDAARILGIDKRVGSIEIGKDADIVLFDGDPFEYTTHVCGVVINGAVVSETCR